ncbi:DNA-binding transcriptional regulator GbsR, MarR family [Arenibacter nanhaiticus]|uniref:DNA-binding transcriptional regulator GbsR, MarR family n=1 Tax=Arenibacter nanhaiticus TaxID=558155 RepID=A0A1M6ALK1_9FLAO|nr:transcriptional regulator [Arenibacter nanhaiticus]SHI37384.1 DNA-binding transcriptional regulator GbsR, MarR family [Arenibacter nanhaiticus]
MNNVSDDKKQLIEEIGLAMEERMGISPLAARIYALLILSSSYGGLTFEEIREIIGASKSSTSININVLLQLKHIEYYTKPGDRKRYFKGSKYFQINFLKQHEESIGSEIGLIDKIIAFNEVHYPEKFNHEKSLGKIIQKYLKAHQELIRNTLVELDEYKENEEV